MRNRCLLAIASLTLPVAAQTTDFKIYPGTVTRFDQSCTSFTSRCSLGAPGGEIFIEYPMRSRDANGAPTDFFRGVGETNVPGTCAVSGVFYLTQDQNGIDQEAYDLLMRPLNPTTSIGPDPDDANAIIPPGAISLLTPPNAPPCPCQWGIRVIFTAPVVIPCDRSLFAGMSLAANSAWVANGQSLQGSWLQGGGASAGDPGSLASAQISWQIDPNGVVGQCGYRRVWDYGLVVEDAVLNTGVLHGDPICSVDPACGIGGLYPSNSARGDGIALCVRDSRVRVGTGVFSFLSFAPAATDIPLTGILDRSIWIAPVPFAQISFGRNTINGKGEARDSSPLLARNRLVSLSGPIWFQSIVNNGRLPLHVTNAAATLLDPAH